MADANRLQSLNIRYERLIAANLSKGYIQTDKADRYLKCIFYLKEQRIIREAENRIKRANTPLRQFLQQSTGLSGFQILTAQHLRALTDPIL